MRIVFFAPFCLLRPTTNRIFDVRMCDALAGQGADVELLHPYYYMKENIGEEALRSAYGVRSDLRFRMLRTGLRETHPSGWQTLVLVLAFAFRLPGIVRRGAVVLMSRDHKLLLPAVLMKILMPWRKTIRLVLQVHEVRSGRLYRWLYRRYDAVWTTTPAARQHLEEQAGLPAERFVSIRACAPPPERLTRDEARRRIGYSDAKPLVVYTGKLGRGIAELEYLLLAAQVLPDVVFLFTGGKADTLAHMRERCAALQLQNVRFSGFLNDVARVRDYQAAADVLVSYYSAKDHLVEYNLPQKLMEYMFTGNPVVTPDFPASRPLVNPETAWLVPPDNPVALAEGIRGVLEHPELAARLAANAAETIRHHTFDALAPGWIRSLQTMTS
jgi:glycosyltransferase involved in cell wall biosynthesis